jgi:hypothetical protein
MSDARKGTAPCFCCFPTSPDQQGRGVSPGSWTPDVQLAMTSTAAHVTGVPSVDKLNRRHLELSSLPNVLPHNPFALEGDQACHVWSGKLYVQMVVAGADFDSEIRWIEKLGI